MEYFQRFIALKLFVNLVLDSISLNAKMIPKEDPSKLVYISQILGNNCKFQFKTHKTNNFYVYFVYHEKKIFEQKKKLMIQNDASRAA